MRLRLCDEDKVFLQRIEPAKRRVTFAHYILDEIRGHPWRRGHRGIRRTNPDDILAEVADRLRSALAALPPDDPRDHEQWLAALEAYPDEARQCVEWYLAWEQGSKREKQAYQWRQYQAYLRSQAVSAP
jgi:hypothetical protein